jgi:hypothetical protein
MQTSRSFPKGPEAIPAGEEEAWRTKNALPSSTVTVESKEVEKPNVYVLSPF